MDRLPHHLKKGRLVEFDGTAFEASIASSSALFIVILFDFTNTKTTLLIVPLTPFMGLFPVPLKLYRLIKVCI